MAAGGVLLQLTYYYVIILVAQTEGDAGYDYDAAYDGSDYDEDQGMSRRRRQQNRTTITIISMYCDE